MQPAERVKAYFEREASRFDAIYEDSKPLHQRVVDNVFRRVIRKRFELICALAPQEGPWSVLDVGCGPGRYALALAARGAMRVVGVDVSAAMIELARAEATRADVAARCSFHASAYLDFVSDERFDVVVATGYFDYLPEPARHLERMVAACRGRVYATFPKRWEVRMPLRKLRFYLERGFVRFYDAGEVRALFSAAGVAPERVALVDLGRDYLAIARP